MLVQKTGQALMSLWLEHLGAMSSEELALTRLFANRISQYCTKEGILPESQSAFRKNTSTNKMYDWPESSTKNEYVHVPEPCVSYALP